MRDAPDIVVGERPYLDILRSASGAIVGTNVLPNPTTGRAVLNFSLAHPRTISISLHDITGRRMREVVSDLSKQGGTYEANIDAGDLADGIYLVAITTDRGERAIQRVIVQK